MRRFFSRRTSVSRIYSCVSHAVLGVAATYHCYLLSSLADQAYFGNLWNQCLSYELLADSDERRGSVRQSRFPLMESLLVVDPVLIFVISWVHLASQESIVDLVQNDMHYKVARALRDLGNQLESPTCFNTLESKEKSSCHCRVTIHGTLISSFVFRRSMPLVYWRIRKSKRKSSIILLLQL